MFGDVAAGGSYPIATHGGEWKPLVMEAPLTAILVPIVLNTATGRRSIGHKRRGRPGTARPHAPGPPGTEVCQHLRERSNVPVII